MTIFIKRIYAPAAVNDGWRVLVDRLWPRGVRREETALDHWLKEIAPSAELRRWFGHELDKWPEFSARYRAELTALRHRLLHQVRLLAVEYIDIPHGAALQRVVEFLITGGLFFFLLCHAILRSR